MLDNDLNYKKLKEFAEQNAIDMESVTYDDMSFNSDEFKEKIADWEGKYNYDHKNVAFVVGGKYYATPKTDEVIRFLSECNMIESEAIEVPFAQVDAFPFRLGPIAQTELCKKASNKAFAEEIIKYYVNIRRENEILNKWIALSVKANMTRPHLARQKTAETIIAEYIKSFLDNREYYNKDGYMQIAKLAQQELDNRKAKKGGTGTKN